MTTSTITFQEGFRNHKKELVKKLVVSIRMLNLLLDSELLTHDQSQQLQATNEKSKASKLLEVLEKRGVGFENFCTILSNEQPHLVASLIAQRPRYNWKVIGLFLTTVLVAFISIGTQYTYCNCVDPPKPAPPKIKQPLPKTIPLVRQNSESFTESLSHLTVIPDLVPYPYEQIAAHIRDITAKARQTMHDLPTKVDVQDLERKVEAYKKFVRPLLENGASAWNPDKKKDIDDIEKVQREFVDSVPGPDNIISSYRQKLDHLGLESLEVRRLRAILMHAYRIAFELVDVDKEGFFVLTAEKARGGHNYRLELRGNPAGQLFHFSSTAVITWNKLPADKVDFTSIEAFEKSLTSDVLFAFCKCKFE